MQEGIALEALDHALEAYKARLRASIERTQRRLAEFEARYGISTAYFLEHMTAEDLARGDLEYVEWAGEARLLESLRRELEELEDVRCRLLEILGQYGVNSVAGLEAKIAQGEVVEHPAREDLIVAENLVARLEELDAYLADLQGTENHRPE